MIPILVAKRMEVSSLYARRIADCTSDLPPSLHRNSSLRKTRLRSAKRENHPNKSHPFSRLCVPWEKLLAKSRHDFLGEQLGGAESVDAAEHGDEVRDA